MGLIRALGCILLIPAILMLSYGVVLWHDGVPLFEQAAGDYLSMTGSSDADPLRGAVQRYVPGALAGPGSAQILQWPLAGAIGTFAGVLAVPGLIILVLFRRGWSRALVRQQYRR